MTFNKIKEYFKNIYNNIVISNDQPMLDRIKEQDKIMSVLENLNKELNETIIVQQNIIKEKDELIASLDYRTDEEKQLETFWNNKYNKGIIRYLGRSYPFSTTKIKFPLNVLLTPNDPDIIEDLKKWKLYRTGEDPETLAPKIYKKVFQTYYRYLYDKEVWNENEVWEMSFEMYEKIREKLKKNEIAGFDCDSWGCFLNSFYIAAGIPRWRIRSVAGMTVLGGHYTCHLYSMVDNKWHHMNCLEKGSLILSNRGYVPIEDLTINDTVLDRYGNFNKINHIEKSIRNKKINILTSGNSDYIGCTPEHKFLTIKHPERWNKKKLIPEFKYASELKRRDLLLMPIQKEQNNLKMDIELCWLLGHYLGDGNLMHRKRSGKFEIMGVRFIKSIKNKALIDKIKSYCKKYTKNKICEQIVNNTSIITIYDIKFARMVHKYCSYANNKELSSELLFMNFEQQKALLKGFIEADGCFTKHREVKVITIVQSLNHKKLINGILFLLRRLNIAYNINCRWNYNASFNQTNKILSISLRNIDYDTFTQSKIRGALLQYKDDYIITSIKDIKYIDTNEEFYDIEVDKTHTYTVDGIICHNSTYGGTFHNKISDYPLITDARNPTTNTGNDIIGLYNIWFSFNDLYMWYSKAEDIPKELQVTSVK